jgi:hypothetical protein
MNMTRTVTIARRLDRLQHLLRQRQKPRLMELHHRSLSKQPAMPSAALPPRRLHLLPHQHLHQRRAQQHPLHHLVSLLVGRPPSKCALC